MTRLTEVARWVLPSVAGIVAGIVTASFLSASGGDSGSAPHEPSAPRVAMRPAFYVDDGVDAGAPQPSVGRAEEPREPFEETRVEADEPMTPERREAERREQRARGQEMHREALTDHAREPIDRAWSREATWRLQDDLDVLATSTGVGVSNIDCRSASCAIALQFRDYAHAREAVGSFVPGRYRVNCQRQISLLDESMNDEPYEAVLLLNCAGQADRGIAGP